MRVGLHREAGQRLAASGAAALQVAEHLARGAGTGDAEAVAWLTRAASEAAPRWPAVAADLLERAVGLADPADPGRDRLLVERAAALMWSGRLSDAEAACRSLLDRDPDPSVAAPTRLLLERDPRILRSAVDAYTRSVRPLELALAAEDAGAGFARQGDAHIAVPLLHQALGAYERLDAAHDTARAEATLRDLGIHRGRRGARRRPQIGWDSLTPTEHRVVDLVVEGLTNPQIGERLYVSRRTVQTHLAHVFTKLGISSRTQLAAEATRRQQGPGS